MAHHWSEGVSSLRFTAREFQLELVEEALKHNLLTCPPSTTSFFVTLKLIQELAYQIRSPLTKKTIILVPLYQVKTLAVQLCHLTDLRTVGLTNCEDLSLLKLDIHEIIVCTSEVLEYLLNKSTISISNINLLIIEQCHMIIEDKCLQNIMSYYLKENSNLSLASMSPKILAFTYPLFTPHDNKSGNKTTYYAKELLREFNKEPPTNHAAIFNLESEAQSCEPYIELECLKGFTQFGNSDDDLDSMEMNSFRYWQTPFSDIIIDESISEAEQNIEIPSDVEEILENVIDEGKSSERSIYDLVEYRLEQLEELLYCKTDMAADIVGLKRITGKPKEIIIECESMLEDNKCEDRIRLEKYMKSVIAGALMFLTDHRYDPTEIYGCDTYDEELKAIPDPCTEPRQMLELFLYVLDEMGVYAADKAAFILLIKLEKLKIKIPYERHFLLLCLVSSTFIQIRAAAELIFENYSSDKDKILTFSTLKVLRLIDILKLFKPKELDLRSPKFSGNRTNYQRQNSHSKSTPNDEHKLDNDNLNLSYRSETPIKDLTASVKNIKIELNEVENVIVKDENIKIILEACGCAKDLCDKCNNVSVNCEVEKTDSTNLECEKNITENQITSLPDKLQDIEKCDFKSLEVKIEKTLDKKVKTEAVRISMKDSPLRRNEGSHRGGRGRGRGGKGYGYHSRYGNNIDPDALCGLIFVDEPLVAKILSSIINEFCRYDDNLKFICAQYTIDKIADPLTDLKEAELEHKLQEEVLKRFRIHDCNLLVGTSFLEEGMDLPKCNLVVKWDIPSGYRSHARCRSRARAPRSLYVLMAPPPPEPLITTLAHYVYIERMLVKKCGWREPPASEEAEATKFSPLIEAYRPSEAAVNLSSAVALLNRYCAKLPSDTFTRLVPLWTMERINYCGSTLYICTIRLPINCPLKHHIVGHPMPNRVLARRAAALQACRALHRAGELDNQLLPIGKESFRAMESDWLSLPPASDLPKADQTLMKNDSLADNQADQFEPRPGTTKRKQYYYKKIAKSLTDCRPVVGVPCLAYQINAWLACPLPERHNTRGRKLHPPEAYAEGFAILTSKIIQKIPVFPIFTRSGEVRVALQKLPGCVVISRQREKLIHYFMKYTFAEVLRVHNHLMLFDEDAVQGRNSYYIVPTTKVSDGEGNMTVVIDWNFLQLIYEQTNSTNVLAIENNAAQNSSQDVEKPIVANENIILEKLKESKFVDEMNHRNIENCAIEKNGMDNAELERDDEKDQEVQTEVCNSTIEIIDSDSKKVVVNGNSTDLVILNPLLSSSDTFVFDNEKFRDAVVMPWYRNQDQPQYFYVAEICWHLSPQSEFPSTQHATFEEYYRHKYGAKITQPSQPLLDVDHTSARLNLLTPRFVNRKGVALPTSSERTKKAKRESLEQKQILVPELCYTHPFRGALWRAAVALPCVLYRINSLLLADEIRKSVALCVALGNPNPKLNFEWPALDFGWSLAEVLSNEVLKDVKTEAEEDKAVEEKEDNKDDIDSSVEVMKEPGNEEKTANDILKEKEDAESDGTDVFEVGMWTNDMAANVNLEPEQLFDDDDDIISANTKLPPNLTICTSIGGGADWNLAAEEEPSPRKYGGRGTLERRFSMADSVISYASSDFEDSENSSISSSDIDDHIHINAIDTFSEKDGVRIEFKSGNEAEAIDIEETIVAEKKEIEDPIDAKLEKEIEENSHDIFKKYFYSDDNKDEGALQHLEAVKKCIAANEQNLKNNGILVTPDQSLEFLKPHSLSISKKHRASNENLDSIETKSNDFETPVSLDYSLEDKNDEVELFIEENNVNPFPEISDIALSKEELLNLYKEMFPYDTSIINENWLNFGLLDNGTVTLDNLEKSKHKILREIKNSIPREKWIKYNFFNMKDIDEGDEFESDFAGYRAESRVENSVMRIGDIVHECKLPEMKFSFDYQPDLTNHPGPSPSLILQGLTMSNANDGINLERLETIGDSFLKYAITTYLYCTYQNIHEGKLSHLRSKQVSNLNLYRLGRRKSLGSRMVAYKFEPHDNWLPPCHRVPPHLERALIDTHIPSTLWNIADMPPLTGLSKEEVEKIVKEKIANHHMVPSKFELVVDDDCPVHGKVIQEIDKVDRGFNDMCTCDYQTNYFNDKKDDIEKELNDSKEGEYVELAGVSCFVPYNLITQHSIPDKSVADCVEALIGAYLIECGPRGALLFMAWLGIRVLPKEEIVLPSNHPFVRFVEELELNPYKSSQKEESIVIMEEPIDQDLNEDNEVESVSSKENKSDLESDPYDNQEENSDFDEDDGWNWDDRIPGSLKPEKNKDGEWIQVLYGELKPPPSPLLRFVPDPEGELMQMLSGYEGLEKTLNYRFSDRCYLLQAMTHASYTPNRLTDCYQRLEFLGDAVLDYLITRQLYEDPRRHSPGALTDLRSALVNNTIFASLAVRHGMHKYFRHLSPGLNEVLARFVKIQEENGHSISEDHYLIQEDECEQVEDVEVPKALGDLFESIAGAIFLDSGMSLDAVWKVYYALMQREIEAFSESVPKSPVRELLEMEPETAKFGKPEKLADGRRVRVTVEVLGVGVFKGVGRNYRIAKCTAAKCALRRLGSSSSRRYKK